MMSGPATVATRAAASQGAAGPLHGRHIVVTRPAAQADAMMQSLAALGAIPLLFPLLEIHDAADRAPLQAALRRLPEMDLAIFVSPNAIERSFAELARLSLVWPPTLPVAVVGKGSERALRERGVTHIWAPQQHFDSEGLLALPELQQVAGWRVLIFRGDGGRELTTEVLRARGATVEHALCYRRTGPSGTAQALHELWQQGALDALTLTSSEGLRHLHAMLDEEGRRHLAQTACFVPHRRIAEQARHLGLARVHLTAAGDAGLLQGLCEFFASPAGSARS